MSKARVSYSVMCNTHGAETGIKGIKELRVQCPKSRKQSFKAGCPVCKKESTTP